MNIKSRISVLMILFLAACHVEVHETPPSTYYVENGYSSGESYEVVFDLNERVVSGFWGMRDYDLEVLSAESTVYGEVAGVLVDLELDLAHLDLYGRAFCGLVDLEIDPYTLELEGWACGHFVEGSFVSDHEAESFLEEEFLNYSSRGFPAPVRQDVEDFIYYLIQ